MKEATSTVLGFLAAPVVAGILFAVFGWIIDHSEVQTAGYISVMFLIGLLFSAVATVVIGVPAFILLRRFGLVRWWSALATGFTIGAMIGIIQIWPSLNLLPQAMWVGYVMRNFIGLGVIGAVAAFTFWMVWAQGQVTR